VDYALLDLLHGSVENNGMPEMRFNYPPHGGMETRLFNKAAENVTSPLENPDWTLINPEDYQNFKESLLKTYSDMTTVIIPKKIEEERIEFGVYLQVNNLNEEKKDLLLKIIEETGVEPSNDNIDPGLRFLIDMEHGNRLMNGKEAEGRPLFENESEKLRVRMREIFSKHLTFWSDDVRK